VNPSTVGPGGSVTVTDHGWQPDSKVDLTLHSTPVALGSTQADGDGNVKTTVVIPSDTAPGNHTIVLTGVDPNGDPQTHTVAVVVESSTVTTEGTATTSTGGTGASGTSTSSSSGTLPRTGSPVLPLLVVSLSLIGAGIALGVRRRRTT
jgi:LPXTG-motif cell wall-anchored protein